MGVSTRSGDVNSGPAPKSTEAFVNGVGQSSIGDRLILCFDGTGNVFSGTPGDTNIVKLYRLFDRENNNQMHYYQPGIGTYPAEGPVNVNLFRTFMRKIEATLDSALATSFDTHVIAGYKFIMRHYKPGDRIYIFGFSRGAFTARFVSRMISHVGLLSRGNEELIPFAYKVYQDYESNRNPQTTTDQVIFMNTFKEHFCRTEAYRIGDKRFSSIDHTEISDNESGIKVHFLGLFDCVSSVGNLDVPFFKEPPPLPAVVGTARHIRHAVAIDERRVKFKAALFAQEKALDPKKDTQKTHSHEENPFEEEFSDEEALEEETARKEAPKETMKEVWFPGNHGDIGGGWDMKEKDKMVEGEDGKWRRSTNVEDDYFQLSDIALKWMIDEIDAVDSEEDRSKRIAWDLEGKVSFLNRFEKHKKDMIMARMHDTMKFGRGSNWSKVLMWKWMDCIPWIIKRWEYVPNTKSRWSWFLGLFRRDQGSSIPEPPYKWIYTGWTPNFGGRRDIPPGALFHRSVIERMALDAKTIPDEIYKDFYKQYIPNNQLSLEKNESDEESSTYLNSLIPGAEERVKQRKLNNGAKKPLSDQSEPQFVPQPHLTTGSFRVEDRDGNPVRHLKRIEKKGGRKRSVYQRNEYQTGKQEWDTIYRVKL